MKEVVNIIKQNRQKISVALLKNIGKTSSVKKLIPKLEDWIDKIGKYGIGCVNSVLQDLAPNFSRAYEDESEMAFEINKSFIKTAVYSNNLVTLLVTVKSNYSSDNEEQKVIDAIVSAIESILKDLQIFYMSIEDAIQNNPTSGTVEFKPNISTPLNVINSYIAKQRQIEENIYNNEKLATEEVEKDSCVFPIIAGFGLGLLMGGDEDCCE